jgi:hypothetical protein
MARSYAETKTFNCPQCGQSFQAEIWYIVDTGERPDLVDWHHGLPEPAR